MVVHKRNKPFYYYFSFLHQYDPKNFTPSLILDSENIEIKDIPPSRIDPEKPEIKNIPPSLILDLEKPELI